MCTDNKNQGTLLKKEKDFVITYNNLQYFVLVTILHLLPELLWDILFFLIFAQKCFVTNLLFCGLSLHPDEGHVPKTCWCIFFHNNISLINNKGFVIFHNGQSALWVHSHVLAFFFSFTSPLQRAHVCVFVLV